MTHVTSGVSGINRKKCPWLCFRVFLGGLRSVYCDGHYEIQFNAIQHFPVIQQQIMCCCFLRVFPLWWDFVMQHRVVNLSSSFLPLAFSCWQLFTRVGENDDYIDMILQWLSRGLSPMCKKEPQIVAKSRPNLMPWAVAVPCPFCAISIPCNISYHNTSFPSSMIWHLAEYLWR